MYIYFKILPVSIVDITTLKQIHFYWDGLGKETAVECVASNPVWTSGLNCGLVSPVQTIGCTTLTMSHVIDNKHDILTNGYLTFSWREKTKSLPAQWTVAHVPSPSRDHGRTGSDITPSPLQVDLPLKIYPIPSEELMYRLVFITDSNTCL